MEKKKTFIIIAVALLVLSIGITFAYFIAKTGPGSSANANVTTGTVDDLKFNVSKENISLNINQFNFASGSGNITDTVTATASLKANSTKNTATYNYYVYFQIESNNYAYTTTDKKPEIVLSITGPNGEITSVDGLTYVSATNADGTIVKGFDITEQKSSVIKVADSYEISSSSSTNYTTQDWTFTVTFINLDTNQADNEGKNLTGKVLIQSNKLIDSVSDVAKSGDNLVTAIQNLSTKSKPSYTGLYHHDSNLTNGAGDNSYRFAGANPNNYVCFGSDETTCPTENLYRIIGVIDGKVKLIHAYGATTDMLGTDEGYVKTYQEEWADFTANYKGNGDLTKIGTYEWNKTSDNTWSTSTTNTTNLNTNYLTYLDGKNTKWKNMIADTTWYVGGMTGDNGVLSNAKTAYNYEVGANKDATTTVTSKIGLMYLSDYYYGATPDYWTLPGFDNNGSWNSDHTVWSGSGNDYSKAYNNNWMSTGLIEWTISRDSDISNLAFYVGDVGDVGVGNSRGYAVRPSFSLSSSIKFTSGEGTAVNPIRIKI
ncbi:unknown [Clostridium sp. CAG:609]|nr:unknown [Clostridium sp. CAG:609]